MVKDTEISSSRPFTLAETKALLEREREEREELTYEQKLSHTHTDIFSRFSPEDARAIVEEAQELDRVTEAHAHKIADLAPTHPDDVKALFSKERYSPTDDEIDTIIQIVRTYL